ncbi:unnamed protein product [Heligmosomoides polygyrus]|uniref:Prophage protein n=1 Tax=Heligmosomoides polygyrus TaxID=6339 RepID=A0A183G5E8_HELPZ|nr:unnamed protein product [Heligmosomoides polygyrus]
MWVAKECSIFLVAGPRTDDDSGWFRVYQQARECIDKYILPEYRTNTVDRLPGVSATVDMKAPCCVLGVIADAGFVVSERQARTFYTACVQLLERGHNWKLARRKIAERKEV